MHGARGPRRSSEAKLDRVGCSVPSSRRWIVPPRERMRILVGNHTKLKGPAVDRRDFIKIVGMTTAQTAMVSFPLKPVRSGNAQALAPTSTPQRKLGHSPPTILDELYAGRKTKAVIGKAPSGKTMLLVDGRPRPLFWANLTGGGPDYRRAGFNTVYHEFWFDQHKPLQERFPEWDKQLLAIKRQGLYVILYIHSIHAGAMPGDFDPQWRDYVQAIVRRYRWLTNLIGWDFCDEPADHLTYPDDAFRDFLRDKYHTIAALNQAWKSTYAVFGDIRLEYQRNGYGVPEGSMATPALPFGIGPKAFDSAAFKLLRNAQANRTFAEAVREIDPDTPLWSGANNMAWPMTQIPRHQGIFVDFYPEIGAGNDLETQDIWAMSIARGSNAHPAMQMLLPENYAGGKPQWNFDPRVLRGWMVESALHGAAGVTWWPWGYLYADGAALGLERVDMCGLTTRILVDSGLFEMRPLNTVAVLYQPYANGWEAASQVYGLLRYPSEEPVVLMRQLKFGSRFGQVDYLSHLRHLTAVALDQYGVVLAQFTPDLTAEDITKLARYVRDGGVLFADVGFDCLRAGAIVTAMGSESKELFGIKTLQVSTAGRGRWVATGKFGQLLGDLKEGADATDDLFQYALDVEPTTAAAALRGPGRQGLYVHPVGKGYAIYCSCLAWSRWTVTDRLFRKIHSALFARRCRIEKVGEDDWSGVSKEPYLAPGYEIARFTTGYALQNRIGGAARIAVRVDGEEIPHSLAPRSVLLVRGGQPIPLGTGIWPAVKGQAFADKPLQKTGQANGPRGR